MTEQEYREWVAGEEWYQTIALPSGVVTRGSVDSRKRLALLERELDVEGKRVLDIGCNSGAYCFWAKQRGAAEVVGIDLFEKRIRQARTLAAHERLDVAFHQRGLAEAVSLGTFDVVMCFAVLTEIPDLLGSIAVLRQVIGEVALVELSLAKPIAYVSRSRTFLRGYGDLPRHKAVVELRRSKHGWMLDPSFEVLETLFGEEFALEDLGPSVRYQLVKVTRRR